MMKNISPPLGKQHRSKGAGFRHYNRPLQVKAIAAASAQRKRRGKITLPTVSLPK